MASEIGRTSSGSSVAVQDGSSSAAESVRWANLPRDLVPVIMWRVMGSEGSWRRRSTVACAGVNQHWRQEVEEFLGVPRGSGMVAFLLSSDPPAKLVRDVAEHAARRVVEHAMCDVVEDAIRYLKDKAMNDDTKAADESVVSSANLVRYLKDKANDVTKAADEFVVSSENLVRYLKDKANDVTKAADEFVVSLEDQISKMTSSLRSRRIAGALQEHVERALQIFRFENKQLSRAVKEATFELLITKLPGILDELRTRHIGLQKGTRHIGLQMRSPLNNLLSEILDNVDRTSSFVILISLLRRTSKQPSLAGNRKFHDLVFQCLMKYTSNIKSPPTVELGSVLFSIHESLQELGKETIRDAIGNSPPQMILTVLQELVKLLGTAIQCHLLRIPKDTNPPAIIIEYINCYLQDLQTLAPLRRRLRLPP